jgi:nickel/cobalt transporter (NicO) family protein
MKHIFLAIITTIFLANLSNAHPLGNFSINQFSRLELEKNQIQIKQILDMAEIPTFQATAEIDSDKNNVVSTTELDIYAENLIAKISSNLFLAVNGENLPLRFVSKTASLKEGAGNLNTNGISLQIRQKLRQIQLFSRIRTLRKESVGKKLL